MLHVFTQPLQHGQGAIESQFLSGVKLNDTFVGSAFVLNVIFFLNRDNYKILLITMNQGGAHGVMIIFEGNGHGNTSSNPGQE